MQEDARQSPMGILHKSITGGSWLTLGYVTEKLIGTFSFFVLARILSPSDFGIVAIVLFVPKLFQTISEPGFGSAAIQRGGDIRPYLNPIWTIQIIKSIAIAAVVYLAGPWIAHFFHAQHALTAIRFGGLFIVIQNLANIGSIFFFKNLDFKKLVIRNISKQAAYVLCALICVTFTHSYIPLIAGTAALYIVETVSTYFLHPYRPQLSFQWQPLKELIGYSRWIFGQRLLDQSYGIIENAVVGRLTGLADLGFYTKAKSLSALVPGFLSAVIPVVSFPAYAQLKEQPEKVGDGFIKSLELIMFFLIPCTLLLTTSGGKLVLIFLGQKWLPMSDPLRILTVYFGMSIIIDLSYNLLSGIGQPDKKVKLDIFKTLLTCILLFLLTPRYGITGASLALTIGLFPTMLRACTYVARFTQLRIRSILFTGIVPCTSSLVLLIPFLSYKETVLHLPNSLVVMIVLLCALCYIGLIVSIGLLWHSGPYKTLRVIFDHLLAKRV